MRLKVYLSCSLKTAAKTPERIRHIQLYLDTKDKVDEFRGIQTEQNYLDVFRAFRYIQTQVTQQIFLDRMEKIKMYLDIKKIEKIFNKFRQNLDIFRTQFVLDNLDKS